MTDAVITEHTESRHGPVVRYYQYGNGGVRVLDTKKALRRLYRFDPSENMMTECDPARPDRTLRRFVFDPYGMIEETVSFGKPARTFRYENGAQRIAVREGGDYGAVGKLFTFEENGVSETGWGRNGEIERVFIFDAGNTTITERSGGWFGDVERIIVFEGIGAALFREPESFLQFLMFTEWSESDRDAHIDEEVAKIRGGKSRGPPVNPYAYTGPRRTSSDSASGGSQQGSLPVQRSAGIPFEESRQQRDRDAQDRYTTVRSDEIALQDRFERARSERGELSKGKSVEIPIEDRFERARQDRGQLSRGKSVEIPLEERFGGSRSEREPLSRGRSVDIPIEERFEQARQARGQLSKGKSVEIPIEERFGGAPRYEPPPARERSVEDPLEDRSDDAPEGSKKLTRGGSIGAASRKRGRTRDL